MWALLLVASLSSIAASVLLGRAHAAKLADDDTTYNNLLFYFNECQFIADSTAIVAHWVFAIEYLAVVMHLPLLASIDLDCVPALQQKVSRTVKIANIVFYSLSAF